MTTYYLSGSQIIGEETNGDIILYTYDAYGSPVGFRYHGADYYDDEWDIYWYEKNLFGDIVGVYNNDDYKLITYEYNAWGNVLVTYHNNGEYTSAVNNPFLYRGYYYDSDLDLYYLNSRYYDSAIGRFISPDDVSYLGANGDLNSYNLYAYCSNNPVMYTDPSGHAPEWMQNALKILCAVAIVVSVTAVTVVTAGAAAYALGASAVMIGAITSGAAVGGLVAGGLEIVAQICEKGIDEIDLGAVAIESFAGSAYGAISGIASTTSSAALRMGMRFAKVALGGLNTSLHGINNGDSFDTIMLNAGISISTGLLIQGAFAGLDAYTGKLANNILQSYAVYGGLTFGLNQMLMMSGILLVKNAWRNRGILRGE